MKNWPTIRGVAVGVAMLAAAFAVACDSAAGRHGGGTGAAGGTGGGGSGGSGATGGSGGGGSMGGDPVTCADATAQKSYVGCDYWPTVTANPVWNEFDFAVVIANTGSMNASVTVTG